MNWDRVSDVIYDPLWEYSDAAIEGAAHFNMDYLMFTDVWMKVDRRICEQVELLEYLVYNDEMD